MPQFIARIKRREPPSRASWGEAWCGAAPLRRSEAAKRRRPGYSARSRRRSHLPCSAGPIRGCSRRSPSHGPDQLRRCRARVPRQRQQFPTQGLSQGSYLWAAEMCNNDENEVLGLLYSGKFLGAEIMCEYNVRMGNYLNEQNDLMCRAPPPGVAPSSAPWVASSMASLPAARMPPRLP